MGEVLSGDGDVARVNRFLRRCARRLGQARVGGVIDRLPGAGRQGEGADHQNRTAAKRLQDSFLLEKNHMSST